MLDNHFTNSPTVGSHDQSTTIEDLQTQVRILQQQQLVSQEQTKVQKEKPKGWFRLKRIRKFFESIVRPVLEFIPKFITAIAQLKNANRLMKVAIA